jgi:Hsp70 protein
MISPGDWVLAIDFGTTNTVAATADERGPSTLMLNGRLVMPSAVFLNPDRKTWSVGDTAIRSARRRLEWFEQNPKRSVPDGTLFLGGQNVPVGEAITAVFRPIIQEALAQHGGRRPVAFIVTHPANWGDARKEILVDAAATAAGRGWPAPETLSEPIAAAQAILNMPEIPEQARVVVLDLGGGTVDATVVDRDRDRLAVVGQPQGRDGIGGEDYDGRLARWMVAEVGAPRLYDSLVNSDDPDRHELAVEIRGDARNTKEQLSHQATVPAQLPRCPPELPDITPVMVSRPQLEALIAGGPGREPGLAESIEVVSSVLDPAPPGPPFAGVFLTGGCSRIPMLGALVQERTGRPPLTYGDPTTAVAQGAAYYAWKKVTAPPIPPSPPPPPPPADSTKQMPATPPPVPERPPNPRGKQLRRLAVLAGSIFAIAGLATGLALANSGPSPAPLPTNTDSATPAFTTAPASTAPPTTSAPSFTTAPPVTTAPPSTAPPNNAPAQFSFTEASQYPCSREGTIRSAAGFSVAFAFVNDTSDPLQIIWIDDNGNRQIQDTLPAGDTYNVTIRTNEAWIIADDSSNCLAIFGINGAGQITTS